MIYTFICLAFAALGGITGYLIRADRAEAQMNRSSEALTSVLAAAINHAHLAPQTAYAIWSTWYEVASGREPMLCACGNARLKCEGDVCEANGIAHSQTVCDVAGAI